MEQLLTAFGIDAKLIAVQILNFLVLMGALTYLLYKPILSVLREREERIAQGIRDAEAAAEAKAAAEAEKQSVLTAAHEEASAITDRATKRADEEAREILLTARHEADDMRRTAEAHGEEIKAKAYHESEAEIAKVAILATEKILKERTES